MPELEFDPENEDFKKDPVGYINSLHDQAVAGLKNKNAELIAKMGKLKPDDSLKSELESLREFKSKADIQAEEIKGNYEKAQKMTAAEFEKKEKSYLDKLAAIEEQNTKLLVDGGISQQLDAINILPALKPAAMALLKSQAKLEEGQALIEGKPLADFIKEWANTDAGKAFVRAPDNSGGGAQGGGTNTKGIKNPFSKEHFNLTDQARLIRENPAEAERMKSLANS